jgi:protein ImuB
MYLRLQLDSFRLFAVLRTRVNRPRGPVVLIDESGRIAELNQPARAKDLCAGMALAQALSRCSGVAVLHVDPAAERAAKRLLWKAAWQLTPQIELGERALAGCATLELVRPDLEALAVRVPQLLEHLRRLGLPGRAGLAATPDWAGFAAISAERFQIKILPNRASVQALLAHLPLAALDCLGESSCRILEGWGLRSLAAVAALPRQELGERLGQLGLKAWDLLNGRAPSLLRIRDPEADYRQCFDLEEPLADLPSLHFLMQRAARALERQLEQCGKLARALSLDLWLEGQPSLRQTINLPEATRRADLIERLLGNYLEQHQLIAPVTKVRVDVDPVDPLSRQAGLFEGSLRNPWRLQETLDQLAGLLGSVSFGVPRLRDSHRPDAYELVALPGEPRPLEASGDEAGVGPPQMGPPMRRMRPPLPIRVLFEQEGPAYIECPLVTGAVSASNGPYAINGDWAEAESWAYLEWDVEIEESGVFCVRRSAEAWHLIGAYD